MLNLRLALLFLSAALFVVFCNAQNGREDMSPEDRALYDMNVGLAGMKEAASNPALLAQLMQDMQDPEIMAEAQKMMNDPQFQAQMKKFEKSADFKESIKKTKEKMNDPNLAAKMEAQMEYMLKKGQDDLKMAARKNMELAVDALQDPDVLKEAAAMMQDPKFEEMIKTMMDDPDMVRQMQEMKNMMNDPAYAEKMQKVGKQFASAMGREL